MIRLTEIRVGEEAERLVLEVLRSGQLAQGEYVAEFERRFAESHDVAHAVAVANGTVALVAALQALGVGPGDEVVTSPFTFVATLNAILAVGATARFVDVGADYNIDAAAIDTVAGSSTTVIMPVHLYGLVADMAHISQLASSNGWRVVEDAAQAVGASRDGCFAGSFDVGTFSLYATKNLWTGEGGVVTTSDQKVADVLRLLRNQGMRERYVYEIPGFNYRMTNVAAALGLPQLDTLDAMNDRRRQNAEILASSLSDVQGLVMPQIPVDASHVFHQFTVRVTEESQVSRDDLVTRLADRGVQAGVYYPRVVADYDCYRGHPLVADDPTPNARQLAKEVVSLPVHQHLSRSDLDRIISAVHEVCV